MYILHLKSIRTVHEIVLLPMQRQNTVSTKMHSKFAPHKVTRLTSSTTLVGILFFNGVTIECPWKAISGIAARLISAAHHFRKMSTFVLFRDNSVNSFRIVFSKQPILRKCEKNRIDFFQATHQDVSPSFPLMCKTRVKC